MKTRYLVIGGAAVAVAAVLLIWQLGAGDERHGQPGGSADEASPAATPEPGARDGDRSVSARTRPGQLPSSVPPDPKSFPYPARSRPLAEGDTLFLKAGLPLEVTGNVGHGRGAAADGASAGLVYELSVDKPSIVGDETAVASLIVTRGPGGPPVAATIDGAELRTMPKGSDPGKTVLSLRFADDGSAPDDASGDSRWSAAVAPGARRIESGRYVVAVRFRVEGQTAEARAVTSYTRANEVPAQFTGAITEQIKDGSLVLSAELDVERGGQYDVHANLFDSGGSPIGRASYRVRVEAGARTVPLTFYGLIFHEKGRNGPYVLRQLRGTHLDSKLPVPMYPAEYTTKDYRIEDFSSATWGTKRARGRDAR